MVKFGAISKTHIYGMLASKDARVRRAAYALLEASNPKLRSSASSGTPTPATTFTWSSANVTCSIVDAIKRTFRSALIRHAPGPAFEANGLIPRLIAMKSRAQFRAPH